jgi:hypothetical protein
MGLESLLFMVPGLLQWLFSSKNPQVQTIRTEQETTPRGYQSPLLGLVDPLMFESLLRNLQSYQGAGMPSGVGGGASSSITNLLGLIGEQWPDIINKATPNPLERCSERCEDMYDERIKNGTVSEESAKRMYQNCLNNCRRLHGSSRVRTGEA